MEKKRLVGVTIIAVTQILAEINVLIFLRFVFWEFNFLWRTAGYASGDSIVVTLFASILCFPLLIFGIGLLKLKNWARLYSMVFAPPLLGIWLYLWLSNYTHLELDVWSKFLLTISLVILYLGYIFFFTRPKVKALFSPPKPNT